jgi:putative chitinase
MLTLAILQFQWPHGDQHIPGLLEGIAAAADRVFAKYGFSTPLLVAHAMAQFSAECGQGLTMVENLNYSAAGLLATFPTHFTPAMANRCAHNPQIIAEIAYGGRMGNAPPPSTDGFTYRGRGLAQVTGKDNYRALNAFLAKNAVGIDIVATPALLVDPAFALECGVASLVLCGCLPLAAKDDVLGVTQKLNGGQNGIAERQRQLALWKAALGITGDGAQTSAPAASTQTPTQTPTPTPPIVSSITASTQAA